MFWPSSPSVASIVMILSGMSSTTRMLTGSDVFMEADRDAGTNSESRVKTCMVLGRVFDASRPAAKPRAGSSKSFELRYETFENAEQPLPPNPCSQHREHLLRIHRFRQV